MENKDKEINMNKSVKIVLLVFLILIFFGYFYNPSTKDNKPVSDNQKNNTTQTNLDNSNDWNWPSGDNYNSTQTYSSGQNYPQDQSYYIDRDEAISEHWDEIKEYLDGSETLEACSSSSGNCYDLDADISNGEITQIYFPNDGYLYFSADIDESGSASDTDQDGNNWDFTLDMDSSIVDNAINDWANSNGYTIN